MKNLFFHSKRFLTHASRVMGRDSNTVVDALNSSISHGQHCVVILDLDDTIWSGSIDCSYGSPFNLCTTGGKVFDRKGVALPLFKDTMPIWDGIENFNSQNNNRSAKLAIASRTATPDWAKSVLSMFRTSSGIIYYNHFFQFNVINYLLFNTL
eukprot:GHVR01017383.1.p1 GENE.GHVR01017383.1~~GHVR01017383.1.p1  ORF type:complete len:153 (-),score=14.75 GHVR01017383.1:196-654(-)